MKKFYFFVMIMMLLISGKNYAQTYYSMASGDYSKNFDDITSTTAWPDGFNGTSSAEWRGLAKSTVTGTIPDGITITTSTTTFVATYGTSGGVQRGDGSTTWGPAGSIILLSTGSTDNTNSAAIELYLDFTGRIAGTLSFSWASVNNSTGNRCGSLRIYTSTDGITYTELVGAQVLNLTNNIPTSGTISSVALPASLNGASTARIRFYDYNGTGGTTGSRPKISIDNVVVTSTAASVTPIVTATSQTATNAANQTVNVQSNLASGKVYIILNGVTQVTQADLDAAVTAKNGASATVSAANTDIQVSTTGLTIGTYYAYAVDGSGNVSPKGTNAIVVSALVINPPAAPGNLTATAASTVQIDLTWTDNSNNEDNFKIESSANGTTWTPLATVNANTVSYSHTGLTEGTLVYYRVYAVNSGGNSGYSNTVNATTLTTPPVVMAISQTVNNIGQSAKVQSNKATGAVCIVLNSITPASVADLDAAVTAKTGAKAAVTAASTDIPVSALGLNPGTYYAYAVDAFFNLSAKGTNVIKVTGIATGADSKIEADLANVYISGNNLVVELNSRDFSKATAEIYDLTGRKIASYSLISGINTFSPDVKGIFLVRMVIDGGVIVKKLYI